MLEELSLVDPTALVELQQAYLDQGYHNKVTKKDFPLTMSDSLVNEDMRNNTQVVQSLLNLIHLYSNCFVCGGWEQVLEAAQEIYYTYLQSWEVPVSSNESSFLLVSIGENTKEPLCTDK